MTPKRARAIYLLGVRRLEERRQGQLRSREEFADRVGQMAASIARLERENRALRIVIQHQARLLDRSEPMRPSSAVAPPSDDYGRLWVKQHTYIYAHRASYLAFVGPIPEGLWVLHSCDNPSCVNPEHLHLGTQADNMREAAERGRSVSGDRAAFRKYPHLVRRGEQSTSAKLTETDVVQIRALRRAGMKLRVIAERFGVERSNIGMICSGRRWAHVPFAVAQ